ncbi:hypothetical protein ACQP2U_24510 [Nocardia sp. CA-084685]
MTRAVVIPEQARGEEAGVRDRELIDQVFAADTGVLPCSLQSAARSARV